MGHRRIVVVVFAVVMAVVVASAMAQRTTGEIIGKVTDSSGSVLPGVAVTLRGAGVAGAPTVVSSESGAYRFPVLPPGSYELEYTLSGFSTLKHAGILVAVGATVELDATLTIGGVAETITVSGETPVVSASSSQVSTSYNRDWVRNAPVKRFSYFDLVNSAPGVSATSNVGQSTSAQSLGSSTNENSYQIDGTDISSTPWLSTDTIDEVEILQLGASAEYGNVQGAVFNIVTRQGSNVFHGDANVYFQSQGLTGRNTDAAADRGFPYHRDKWQDTTVQVSGPFLLDRFWFFGAFQYQRDWDSQPGVDPNFPSRNDTRRVFWKFNYNINTNHRLMHGYHNDYYFIPGIASAFTAPSTIDLSHGDNPTPNLVYTGVLSDRTVVETRFSGFWLHSSNDPNEAGQGRVQARFEDQDTGLITGGISSWGESRSWRYGMQSKLSHTTERFLGGSHDTKVGVQYSTHGSDNLSGPNDTFLTYSVTGRPTTGTTQLPFHQGANAQTIGTYVDDTYRLGRATLNLGVRYDFSRGMFPSFPLLDAVGQPTGEMSASDNEVYRWSTFSPRVGVNYRLTASGRSLVKAHYGRYYKALEATEIRPAVPSITPAFNFTLDAAGNRTNIVQISSNANLRIDPDFKSAYSDQYIVQFEHELMRNVGVQVNYVHKRGEDYGGWQDISGEYEAVPYVDNLGVDATGETVSVYRLLSDPASRVFLQTNPEGMYSRYNGMTFTATKRMARRWQGVLSVVLSKATGRLGSSARFTPSSAQSSQAGTFGRDAAGPNDFVNTEGRLIGDRPVVAKAQVLYQFPWGILASVNVQHQTGRLYTRAVRVSGLGFPTAPQINMEANTGERRVDDVNLLDARVQKAFRVSSESARLEVFMDALNLTNSDQAESVGSSLGTSSAFGAPTRYIAPRRVQLGAKIRW